MKRLGDLFVAGILLVLLGLPLLGLGLVLLLSQGRPVLFRQSRIGLNGLPFDILKFRTMRSPQPGEAEVTSGDADVRITPIGAALRRRRIDELPQLWNVVRGDMSLVGPRPEVPRFVDLNDPIWQAALSVRPGITGPDALAFRNEGEALAHSADAESHYREVLLPAKLQIQAQYAAERNVLGDLWILFRTLGVLRG